MVLVALREELGAVRALLESPRPASRGRLGFTEGRAGTLQVVAARTGIGGANAARRTGELIEALRPALILATGFAGALRPGLSTGEILIASEVVEVRESPESGRGFLAAGCWRPPKRLLEAALAVEAEREQLGGAWARATAGRLVTVTRVCRTPEEKRRLGQSLAAEGVDMECSAIAGEAAAQGIPVLCFRAILDDVDCELPFDFGKILTPSGRPRPARVLAEVIRHPRKAGALRDLAVRARTARGSFGSFLKALLRREDLQAPGV